MLRSKAWQFYSVCLVIFLSVGCAQVVVPSGGPKDTKPPKPVSFDPENKSIHFATKRISIKFNKFIQLKDLPGQLVVSPPLKRPPVATIKKSKILELTIKDTLHDNTTYTFNFGNSIADINEGNVLAGFQYVFSTGSYIDSIKLIGKVKDAFTNDPQKDALVMLYANPSDSAPYKIMPSYCGRTNASGDYRIENIKNGFYRIFVLAKGQNGYLYHALAENIGFKADPINLERDDTADVSLFMEEDTKFRFIKARALERGKILLVFSSPADSISVKPLNLLPTPNLYTLFQYSSTRDSVYYWINAPHLDSLHFIILRNGKNLDTANIYSFPGVKIQSKKGAKPLSLRISSNAHDKQSDYDYHYPITLRAEHPIMKYNVSRIRLMQRQDTIKFRIDTTQMPFQLAINCDLMSDSTYKLFVLPGAFNDIFGLVNDTMIMQFKVQDPGFFGTLQMNINLQRKGKYIVQLLDEQARVVSQSIIGNSNNINYGALPPGNYKMRAIKDDNNDGKWTTGNYLRKLEPEKVYNYSDPITIRSDWDLTQDWIVK